MSSDLCQIKIQGMKELQKSLKELGPETGKMMRPALNDVAGVVVRVAQPKIPVLTGKARGSVRANSTATAARVAAGGARAEYYPWLDYGGKVGRKDSVSRPFERHGRYLYPAYWSQQGNIQKMLEDRIRKVIAAAGMEMT